MSGSKAFDLVDTYLHIEDGPKAVQLPVGDDFWQTLPTRTDLGAGRLVASFRFEEDWKVWEMHPAGDEVVCLLSGSIDVILERDGREEVIELRDRGACVVPAGVQRPGVCGGVGRSGVHAPPAVEGRPAVGLDTSLHRHPEIQPSSGVGATCIGGGSAVPRAGVR